MENNTYSSQEIWVLFSMRQNNSSTAADRSLKKIKEHGGVIRTAKAIQAGIHPRTLYRLRDEGDLEQIARGVFRIPDSPSSMPDLIAVASRISNAVICLDSALAFHQLTTQIPRKVAIAIPKGAEKPRMDHPPIKVHWFSAPTHAAGVEEHPVDGVTVRVYGPEKTLADCFKFRNKIGMDVVLEALKLYRLRMKFNGADLVKYGRICRVEKVMRPYLEAVM
jgi:predicted transcriptional regulator of viral defense system